MIDNVINQIRYSCDDENWEFGLSTIQVFKIWIIDNPRF